MKRPVARPTADTANAAEPQRLPRAFAPQAVQVAPAPFELVPEAEPVALPRRPSWLVRIAWTTGGVLVSAALGLAADRLIRDLFATQPWLGWAGLAVLAAFIIAVVGLAACEVGALRRLQLLDELRREAIDAASTNAFHEGKHVADRLVVIYADRPDLARGRAELTANLAHIFDGSDVILSAERSLLSPIDARAKALTAASARRVALVTAVSPRALVDVAFVVYESIRLAGAIATLYGARPGIFGFWRLTGAVLAHLAVTGGLVLTDGIVEQLVGQGLAAKVSARLGEGVVNGLMTVRVGIAAMRVVRPLPYAAVKQPLVRDFIGELTKVAGEPAA